MFSENECCYFTGATMEDFPDNCDDAEYYKWAKVDRKVKKVVQSADVEEAVELFNGKNFGSADPCKKNKKYSL